jgi:hypothetical protein
LLFPESLQEQELEKLRALLKPEHWPRIYAMRAFAQKFATGEKDLESKRSDAAQAMDD